MFKKDEGVLWNFFLIISKMQISKKVFIVMKKFSQIFLKIKPLKSRYQNDSEHVHNF